MPEARSRRVTLYDVAHQSGVSYQTVSRVINGHPHVSSETRERVLVVIKELDYRPNRAAQSLVTRRSHTLEIITFGTSYYGPAQMVASVERAAKRLGYHLTYASLEAFTLDEIRTAADSLSDRLVDGIVMIAPLLGAGYDVLTDLFRDIPYVLIDPALGADVPSVLIDQRYGSHLATQYLLDLGHRTICEISGPLNWVGAAARHESWLETLAQAGVPPGLSVEGDWSAASGYQGAKRLLESGEQFTGLVVGNDQMALGAQRAFSDAGKRIPEDISIVGFDDIPESAFFSPPLTTVRQDFDALGRTSLEYLVMLIDEDAEPPSQRILYPTLIERQSTRPHK